MTKQQIKELKKIAAGLPVLEEGYHEQGLSRSQIREMLEDKFGPRYSEEDFKKAWKANMHYKRRRVNHYRRLKRAFVSHGPDGIKQYIDQVKKRTEYGKKE